MDREINKEQKVERIKILGAAHVNSYTGQVWCWDFHEREYTHRHVFPNVFAAKKFADKVNVKGDIGASYWSVRIPYPLHFQNVGSKCYCGLPGGSVQCSHKQGETK